MCLSPLPCRISFMRKSRCHKLILFIVNDKHTLPTDLGHGSKSTTSKEDVIVGKRFCKCTHSSFNPHSPIGRRVNITTEIKCRVSDTSLLVDW